MQAKAIDQLFLEKGLFLSKVIFLDSRKGVCNRRASYLEGIPTQKTGKVYQQGRNPIKEW